MIARADVDFSRNTFAQIRMFIENTLSQITANIDDVLEEIV